MKTRPAVLFLALVVCLAWTGTADASRAPTEQELAGITAATTSDSEVPEGTTVSNVRVNRYGVWALATLNVYFPGQGVQSSLGLYRLGEEGGVPMWSLLKVFSEFCIGPSTSALGLPRAVGLELGLKRCDRPPKVFVRDSTRHLKVEPRVLRFAYEALFPGFWLTHIGHWRNWSYIRPEAASAKGVLHYDTCKPNCAEGHYVRIRARVMLTVLRVCDGRHVFGRISIKPRGLPEHTHRIQCNGFLL